MGKKQKMDFVEIELDPIDAAKAKILCERKGLPFPSGISFLVQEVVQLKWKDIESEKSVKQQAAERTENRKSTSKHHRNAGRKMRFSR